MTTTSITGRKMQYKRTLYVIFYIAVYLGMGQLFGQTPPKQLSVADYHLWGSLYTNQISPSGEWLSYHLTYDEHPDTLHVRNSRTGVSHAIVEGYGSMVFNGDKQFGCMVPGGALEIVDLETGGRMSIPKVSTFFFSANGKYLVTLQRENADLKLFVRDIVSNIVSQYENISSVAQSPDHRKVLMLGNDGAKAFMTVLDLSSAPLEKVIAAAESISFTAMVWQEDSNGFAVVGNAEGATNPGSLFYYSIPEGKLSRLNESDNNFPRGRRLAAKLESLLRISGDGKTVFFGTNGLKGPMYPTDSVQVWNGNDSWLFPRRKVHGDWHKKPLVAAWSPREGNVIQLASEERPHIMLSGDAKYAITFNPEGVTHNHFYEEVNMYLTNLATGTTELWLEAQSPTHRNTSLSPDGKYVAVYRGGRWMLYEFATRKWRDLQGQIKLDSHKPYNDFLQTGIGGWSKDFVFLYDGFDIWQIPLRGGVPNKITDGRKNKTVYRIYRHESQRFGTLIYNGYVGAPVDTNRPVILDITGEIRNGYCLWSKKEGIQPMVYDSALINNLMPAGKDSYYFTQESANCPTAIRTIDLRKKKITTLVQSNPHYVDYGEIRVEVVDYATSDFKGLKGILYYPENYIAGQQYPMIVHIYEQQIYMLHYYLQPSLHCYDGFNIRHLTAQGYFVYLPEINYLLGDTGMSAAKCVVAATEAIIAKGLASPGKIGLIGHSFGGYETNFIITQTNLFSAAVSGAGSADTTDHYFSMNWNGGDSNAWRYVHQQWRMGKSPFEDQQGYDRNSARLAAPAITTPLLLWSGEKDLQVNTKETISFYLALHELRKKCIFLLYSGEGHGVEKEEFQLDLVRRIDQWYGHYLKGEPAAEWITNGTK